mgnify:CR=1 FL=1
MEVPTSPVMPCKMDLDKVMFSGCGWEDRDWPKCYVGLVIFRPRSRSAGPTGSQHRVHVPALCWGDKSPSMVIAWGWAEGCC